MRNSASTRVGMTVVEILIVITIIALLLQLALPAVEMSREAARQTQCLNNLRQIGLAAQLHVTTHGHFPTGGWSSVWSGDPKRGYGPDQPGGWCYNVLPYLEEVSLHDMGLELAPIDQRAEGAKMFETPVPVFVCPSRRLVRAWPFARTLYNIADTDKAGRSDYAANIGSLEPRDQRSPGPVSYADAKDWVKGNDIFKNWAAMGHNGVVYQRSKVSPAKVTDGLSKTFFGGEKFLSPAHYKDGNSHGDDQSLYIGFDRDTARSTNTLHPPLRDAKRESAWMRYGDSADVIDWNFGSPHLSSCNFVHCDGSVNKVAYDVDMELFSAMGSRGAEPSDVSLP
ncbi:DUF1559 family PulG-like putative transporter [Botrimarina hoheduenensis]|uniref:DUF1559 domain-containing protein n=1 Tax=Botrimarina hoheduenensis TaxID=2528000 RepID=A0A5C5VRX7_9BACT|nr:DUF1559 domain-containing protein [Botrimarina hoheduenensis]TWT41348.1 hypothetical protein Pla111_30620 [Botrimarina hoheduenensis]